jgi:ADP-ribosylglycohydrolase
VGDLNATNKTKKLPFFIDRFLHSFRLHSESLSRVTISNTGFHHQKTEAETTGNQEKSKTETKQEQEQNRERQEEAEQENIIFFSFSYFACCSLPVTIAVYACKSRPSVTCSAVVVDP